MGQKDSILASAIVRNSDERGHDAFDSRMYDMRLVLGVSRVRIERLESISKPPGGI